MITTTEILQTIPKLSQEDCFQIAEILLQRLLTQTKPTRAQINQQLKIAALLAVEVLGVKKEILCLAFACNESVSTIRKSLDCTCHVVILCCVRNPTPFLSLR